MMSSSWLIRVVLVPSAVFLSALFGGAYGSGREVAEFISRHGPVGGLVAIVVVALTYAICMFLVYELARVVREFEVRGFATQLLGKARFLYEALLTVGLLLALAICAAAGGAIANNYFDLPTLMGGAGVLGIIVVLTYFGRAVVEKSMIASVAALGLLLVYLAYVAVTRHGHDIALAFEPATFNIDGLGTGLKYALTSCGFLTLLLYSVRDLKSRSETAVASVAAAVVGVIPAIAFHVIFMMSYPEILDETLPAYTLFETIMPAAFLDVYVFVVFVLVALTGVALLQGVVESLDKLAQDKFDKAISRAGHAAVSGGAMILAFIFSSIGIVDLIIGVFGFLSIAFFVVFFVPLFTRGVWLIWRSEAVSQ
jgi:uncharacterized membrane protein YkvI